MLEYFSNHSKDDTDWFAHNVGYSLIGMGEFSIRLSGKFGTNVEGSRYLDRIDKMQTRRVLLQTSVNITQIGLKFCFTFRLLWSCAKHVLSNIFHQASS